MTWDHSLTEHRIAAQPARTGKGHGAPHEGGWTDARVEQLKKLCEERLSASQIAGIMGGGLTRNGVIGKIHRLKLNGTRPKPAPRPALPKAQKRLDRLADAPRPRKRSANDAIFVPGEPLPPDTSGIGPDAWLRLPGAGEPIPLLALREGTEHRPGTCRWPLGDPLEPGFGFCGCQAMPGKPYCEAHSRRALMFERARGRLAELRLKDLPTEGRG